MAELTRTPTPNGEPTSPLDVHVHVHLHLDPPTAVPAGNSVDRRLDSISTLLRADAVLRTQLMATVQQLNTKIDQLKSSVEAETNLAASIVTWIQGQGAIVADLKKQLADALAAGGDQSAALQSAIDTLDVIETTNDTNAKQIADLMIAGTPAAE